jgi:hypothetical protein
MISLKIFGTIRGEAQCEIIVASQLHAGLVGLWKLDLRPSGRAVNLGPKLSSNLPERWRSRQHDTVSPSDQPPECCERKREGLPDSVTGLDGSAGMDLDGPQYLDFALPKLDVQYLGRE